MENMVAGSGVLVDAHDKAINECENVAAKVDQKSMVILVSDDEDEALAAPCKVAQSQQKLRRRRLASRMKLLQVPLSDMILITSSDSSEGESIHTIPEAIVQSFDALKLGKDSSPRSLPTNIVTMEVQTEISIPPKVFLEPSMVKAMLCNVSTGHQNPCKASGVSNLLSPDCILKQPTTMKQASLTLEGMNATKNLTIGKPYEDGFIGDSGHFLPCLSNLVELQNVETDAYTSIAPRLPLQKTKKIMFGKAYEVAKAPSSILQKPNMQESSPTSKNTCASAKMIFGQPFEDISRCTTIALEQTRLQKVEDADTSSAAHCLPTQKMKKVSFGPTYRVAAHKDVSSSESIEIGIPPAHNTRSKAKNMENKHKVNNI